MEVIRRLRDAFEDNDSGIRIYFDVLGNKLKVDDKAPDFSLVDDLGAIIRLDDLQGRKKLLNLINSFYTEVCDAETCRFDRVLKTIITVDNLNFCTISMNLPPILSYFRKEQGIHKNHLLLSDHRTGEFGMAYGALMMPDRMLQRTVFVLNEENSILYAKYFKDQGATPDYKEALDVLFSR